MEIEKVFAMGEKKANAIEKRKANVLANGIPNGKRWSMETAKGCRMVTEQVGRSPGGQWNGSPEWAVELARGRREVMSTPAIAKLSLQPHSGPTSTFSAAP